MNKSYSFLTKILTSILITLMMLFFYTCANNDSSSIDFLLDWKAGMEYIGFFVAREKGFYKDVGLNINIIEGNGATTSAKLISSGKYCLGMCTGDALIIGAENNYNIISLAVLFQRSPVVIFSLKEKNIKKIQDLIGHSIGVSSGDTKYNYFRGILNRYNITKDSIKEASVGWEVAPLLSGKVDALLGYINVQPLQVQFKGYKVNIIKLSELGLDIYSELIIGNKDYINQNPEIVRKFIIASIKGWKYSVENPEEAVSIFKKNYPEYDTKFLKESINRVIPLLYSNDLLSNKIGEQTIQGWNNTCTILKEFQLIKKKTSVKNLFTNSYSVIKE